MIEISKIQNLLEELDNKIADELEGQELDFKEWAGNAKEMIQILVRTIVSFANADGGIIIVGIRERVKGRENAILGIPKSIDILDLQRSVYDRTEPHITVKIHDIAVEFGTGRILAIQVFPGMPPYTNSEGAGWIRVGKENRPLTGSRRREMMESMGYHDATAAAIDENWKEVYSPVAMERLREMMAQETTPLELQRMSDEDLLQSIGAIKEGKMIIAGVLMVGKPQYIEKYVPCHRWAFRKMISDTEYTIRDEGVEAIPVALHELERYLETDNPVSVLEVGFLHPEFKKYPLVAIREGIMNAFVHRDYRIPGSVMIKLNSDEMIISNPGDLIGGITPENILHHAPVSRNNALANILEKIRLVNRSNLGVPRIYSSMLREGKEAPIYEINGENVELTLRGSVVVPSICALVQQLSEKGVRIEVDELIILNYLLRHREITAQTAAEICQRTIKKISETLNRMDVESKILSPAGKGRGRYYALSRGIHKLLAQDVQYSRNEQMDEVRLKAEVLTLLKEQPLSNQEIRQMTGQTAQQVRNWMLSMESEGVTLVGKGRGAKYVLQDAVYK